MSAYVIGHMTVKDSLDEKSCLINIFRKRRRVFAKPFSGN